MEITAEQKNKRVLIVDDEPSLRDLFALALTNESREVSACADGFSAFRMMDKTTFDLILLDLSLPDVDGIQILREMRRKGNQTRVILCSAHVNEKAFLDALELGASAFISKPVTLEALRNITHRVINGMNGHEDGSPELFAEKFNFSARAKRLARERFEPIRKSC